MMTWVYIFLGIAAAAAGFGLVGASAAAGDARILSVLFFFMSLATLFSGAAHRA
ncbi:MAG: DUF1328 domain-containing protein [Bryobacteraceae bacterium]